MKVSITLRDGDNVVSFKNDGSVTLRNGDTSFHAEDAAKLQAIVRTLGSQSPLSQMVDLAQRMTAVTSPKVKPKIKPKPKLKAASEE